MTVILRGADMSIGKPSGNVAHARHASRLRQDDHAEGTGATGRMRDARRRLIRRVRMRLRVTDGVGVGAGRMVPVKISLLLVLL